YTCRRTINFSEHIMKLEDAIILRIEQLCIETRMTKYSLYLASGVPQTTLTSIKKKRCRSIKVSTLYAICEGFGISLEQFFNSPLFSRENIVDDD
ncbi:MAG: helix-turn-helix transcriptional regulator, partial [Clostridia bacterium]|nr:helix-turn-helix transcriptional regulator [Clostridia bacterium]